MSAARVAPEKQISRPPADALHSGACEVDMRMYDVEVVRQKDILVIKQQYDGKDEVVLLSVDQAEAFCMMLMSEAGIDSDYPRWVRAGYGTKEMAIADGVSAG